MVQQPMHDAKHHINILKHDHTILQLHLPMEQAPKQLLLSEQTKPHVKQIFQVI